MNWRVVLRLGVRLTRLCSAKGKPASAGIDSAHRGGPRCGWGHQTMPIHALCSSRANTPTGKPVMKVYTAGSDSSLKTLAAGIFAAILFSSFAGAAWGQGAIKTKFEAWEFRC